MAENQQIAKINPLKEMEAAIASAKTMRDLIKVEALSNRYIANYKSVAMCSELEAKARFEMEALAFMEIVSNKPELNDCDPYSVYAGFVKAGVTGLSFRSSKLSVYKRGAKQKDGSYKQLMVVEPDAHGKKEMLGRMPDIKKVDEGVVVYKDDVFVYSPKNKLVTKHEQSFPVPVASKETVKAAYCTIHFADGTQQDVVMSIAEIEIARSKSQQPEGMMWKNHYAEACKKTTYNRAYKVNYKMPSNAVIFKQYDAPEEVIETESEVVNDATPIEAAATAEVVDEGTGEVLTPEVNKEEPKINPPKKGESFIPQA